MTYHDVLVCDCWLRGGRARAGFFLFAVQPFKLGDRVAVSYSTPASGGRAPWFEGICEKVDLRYAAPLHCTVGMEPEL